MVLWNRLGDSVQCLAFNPVTHHLLSCSSVDIGKYAHAHKHTHKYAHEVVNFVNDNRHL